MKISNTLLELWCKEIPRGFPLVENGKFIDKNDLIIFKKVLSSIVKKNPKLLMEARMSTHITKKFIPNKRYENDLANALGDLDMVKSLYEMPLTYNPSTSIDNSSTVILIGSKTVELLGSVSDIKSQVKNIDKLTDELNSAPKSKKSKIQTEIKKLQFYDDIINFHSKYTRWESESLIGYVFFVIDTSTHIFTEQTTSSKSGLSMGASPTDMKEAMVCYGYTIDTTELTNIVSELLKKQEKSLQDLNYSYIDIENSKETIGVEINEFLQKLYSSPINKTDSVKKTILNSFSSAQTIKELFGSGKIANRGDLFNTIRNKAVSLITEADLSVKPDKWCPADIYLVDDSITESMINNIKTLSGPMGLNSLFADNITDSNKIFAISLKEENALQGKSTDIVNVSKNLKIPNKQLDDLKLSTEVMSFLKSFDGELRDIFLKHNMAIPKSLNLAGLLHNGKGVPELQKVLSSDRSKANPQKNPNFNSKAYNELVELDKKHKKSKSDVINMFNEYRNNFYTSLSKYNVSAPTFSHEDIPIDSIIKKIGVYKYALFVSDTEFFNSIKKELSKSNIGNQTMKQYNNPFVALCAYAIGLSGLNPTFWKVTGKNDGSLGSYMKFMGNTVLKFNPQFDLEIQDSILSTDIAIKYVVSADIQTSKSNMKKNYSVSIRFRYDLAYIRIEVEEFKQK